MTAISYSSDLKTNQAHTHDDYYNMSYSETLALINYSKRPNALKNPAKTTCSGRSEFHNVTDKDRSISPVQGIHLKVKRNVPRSKKYPSGEA